MKNIILSLFSLLPSLSWGYQASEILYFDLNSPSTFLLSNSLHETTVQINNGLADNSGTLDCDDGNKRKIKIKNGKPINLFFSQKINTCTLKIGPKTIKLIKDEKAYPILRKMNHKIENCNYQNSASDVSQLILTNDYPMLSCATSSSQIEILPESEDGVLSKMEALLGYKPTKEFVHNQNPYAELDFSKAPKLDAIFISTLLYRHDFTGAVIGRLVKFHAKRGTLINIIGTGYMHEEKDKKFLKELAQTGANVRIQEYSFVDPYWGAKLPMSYVDNHYRNMHVKMFVTLSSTDPKSNVVITGGRNIHDGFHFSEKPDLSNYPNLSQSPEGPYAYWTDLEIKITSTKVAESVYAHLLKLWNRKIKGQVVTNISNPSTLVDGDKILNSKSTMMRHILSMPFNDNHALEKLFVEMIDNAQNEILLSSPYLRPTKAIMKAFERAIQRNVEITIQTRINLEGDTLAWLYEETNKAAINALYKKIKIYEWTEDSILHTKMILIDGKFAFFGSVNVSSRSFIQDVESGFLIHDENFVQSLIEVFKGYTSKSRLLNSKQKRKLWASLLIGVFKDQF